MPHIHCDAAARNNENLKFEFYVDRSVSDHYTFLMKGMTTILLAVLFIMALSPLAMFSFPVPGAGEPLFGALDVCHSAAPALSSGGDMPCLLVCPCDQPPALAVNVSAGEIPLFTPFLLPSQLDHPPHA